MRATRRCCSHRAMTHPLPSDSSGQRAGRAGHEVARKIADGTSRSSEHERFQRYLSLGIPAVTVAVLAIYVLMWWASNANPALRASPADQWVVGQVTEIAPSTWQSVGTGGVSNSWHAV